MRRTQQVMQLLLLGCAGFALVSIGLFALQLVKTTKQVEADVTAAQTSLSTSLGKVDVALEAVTACATELQPVIAKLPGTVAKLNAAADEYKAIATTINGRLPGTFDRLDGAIEQFAAAGAALNDPEKGVKATLQNTNAILVQAGIASGEAAQASITQKKNLEDLAAKLNGILSSLKAMADDGKSIMHDLANPKKAPLWLKILGLVLGGGAQGAAKGAVLR